MNFWYIIIYFAIPAITLANPFYINTHFKNLVYNEDFTHFYAYIIILIFYFSMLFSYKICLNIKNQFYVKAKSDIRWKFLSIILLIISILGFLIFINGYGGFSNVYKNINTIRSGVYERNTFAAIGRMFTSYSIVAMLILIVIIKRKKLFFSDKIIAIALFVFAFFLTIIFTTFSGGRGGFLFPIIQLYIIKILLDKKIDFKVIFILLPFIIFVILYGKFIFSNLNEGIGFLFSHIINDFQNAKYIFRSIIINFTHPYYSLIVSIKTIGQNNPIYFLNPVYTLKFFLHLFGLPYTGTISHLNTFYILRIFDSNIPPGIVGLSYYNFMLPGVVITGIMYGCLLSFIEKIFINLKEKVFGIVFYSITIDIFSQYIFNGDFRVFIMQRITLLLLIIFILLQKISIIRKREVN